MHHRVTDKGKGGAGRVEDFSRAADRITRVSESLRERALQFCLAGPCPQLGTLKPCPGDCPAFKAAKAAERLEESMTHSMLIRAMIGARDASDDLAR